MKSLIQRRADPPPPLGEIQHNQQSQSPTRQARPMMSSLDVDPATRLLPTADIDAAAPPRGRSRSPTKNAFNTLRLKAMASAGGAAAAAKSREPSPTKPKKNKSSTNLAGLLGRPKSLRNLQKLMGDGGLGAEEDPARMRSRDKENRSPAEANSNGQGQLPVSTPIYARFARDAAASPGRTTSLESPASSQRSMAAATKPRPRSFHQSYFPSFKEGDPIAAVPASPTKAKTSPWVRSPTKSSRPKLMSVLTHHSRSKSYDVLSASAAEPRIEPQDIDRHLEAMLDRRNIPENQRYKMRNLTNTIKTEFIRQDWAEMAAAAGKAESPRPADAADAADPPSIGSSREDKSKRSRNRGKSFTLAKGSKWGYSSSSGKKGRDGGTLGRHFRTKSTESVGAAAAAAGERPGSGHSASSAASGIFSKIKLNQGPADFVAYLRKVTKPEVVEVGKLHKLRLLLRNETVSWTEEFMQQGGMKEIVDLLNRIIGVEWREEHEDALLHETLLCLKALCTTALALQYIHSIQDSLFPRLLFMIFDPEKKGPSEFTTRNIITAILFTYIDSAPPADRPSRAATVLAHLRDPEPPEEERPVPFVMDMWRQRPYRVWCKEATNVTKEVFWIFLHHVNVITLLRTQDNNNHHHHHQTSSSSEAAADLDYMARHFPRQRPPVPAAPYVGGVEWDATNYLASHLDLINAILACTPSRAARNALRSDMRVSGWERCLGGSLRLCKEKFYGAVHEGLRTWVAAAAEDGWDTRDVRYGPPPAEPRSPVKATGAAKREAPPRIEMPGLDLGVGGGGGVGSAGAVAGKLDGGFWLS